ncbi:regulatory protein RecX [Porphyromonas sp. COT-290 OH860]|uniref:regulatory protein RecX n=1 Tax=Porphyromonas sp. COT-290 OH860 TaxID=1515615 RepID=UPI0005C5211E|nr:regulatory protein RecX [Porphyromonas sp. COT-290 OH860]
MRQDKAPLTREQALGKAARYCVGAERCLWEVRRKLEQWEASPEDYADILNYLQTEGFVDEGRYAEAFARDKHRFSGWGARRIEQELRGRHLKSADIAAALRRLEEELDPREQLQKLLEKKYKSLPSGLDRHKVYERLMRYGLYRGYDYEAVSSVASALTATS